MTIGYLSGSAAWAAPTAMSIANARNLVFTDSSQVRCCLPSLHGITAAQSPGRFSRQDRQDRQGQREFMKVLILPWRPWRENFLSGLRLCRQRRLQILPPQMNFLAVDGDLQRRFDADLDAIGSDGEHRDADAPGDDDGLIETPGQNQHESSLCFHSGSSAASVRVLR